MADKKERRTFKIEVRQLEDGSKVLAGTPIVYGKKSEDMGFFEFIDPGAAREAMKISDPRLLYGHNSDSLLPIARKKSGTLREVETKNGVEIEADPPKKNPFVDALIESIEREDIAEMSFGFTVAEDKWTDTDKDRPTRNITKIGEIFDYSYVAFAAYNDTAVALRSLDVAKGTNRSTEDQEVEKVTDITITVRDKWLKTENTFDFTGDTRFIDAAEKIQSLIPEPSGEEKDAETSAEDLATRAQDEAVNLDIDILFSERTQGGLKR